MQVLSEILFPALEEAKQSIPSAEAIQAKGQSALFGEGGLDSMGLVQFIIIVEEKIQDLTNVELTLASDKAMSRRSSPFATLDSLAEYIQECLAEEGFDG